MAKYDFTGQLPDKAFTSDGCSGGLSKVWRRVFGCPVPIEPCCFQHDIEYHFGAGRGASWWRNFVERLQADFGLFWCSLWEYGFKRIHKNEIRDGLISMLLAIPVFIAVRIGGGAYWPTKYRWGFGWD